MGFLLKVSELMLFSPLHEHPLILGHNTRNYLLRTSLMLVTSADGNICECTKGFCNLAYSQIVTEISVDSSSLHSALAVLP